VSLYDVMTAASRLRPVVELTPVVSPKALCETVGRPVALKCENLQRTGSFKVRGALNALMQMPNDQRVRGVITDSSGNFGLGLAWAGKQLAVDVSIVMPKNAPAAKRQRAVELGASVHLSGATLDDRARVTDEIAESSGAVYVSPHDDRDVIAGQGTTAVELVEQTSAAEMILVPVGGGGLIAGVAVVVKERWPEVRVIGVQPSGAADAAHSLELGRRVSERSSHSIAGGLLANLGVKNWAIIQRLVDDIVVVDDIQIVAAVRTLWECARLLVEPSAGIVLAALTSPSVHSRVGSGRAVAILSGGNVDLDDLPWSTDLLSAAALQPAR
jgi:threonine dehydratase